MMFINREWFKKLCFNIPIFKFYFLFQLCDISLRAGVTSTSAHRVVLAAASPYFHAMFNGKLIICLKIGERVIHKPIEPYGPKIVRGTGPKKVHEISQGQEDNKLGYFPKNIYVDGEKLPNLSVL